MELRFHPQAITDARRIYQYYSDVSHDLGDEFWDELEQFIEHARLYPREIILIALGKISDAQT